MKVCVVRRLSAAVLALSTWGGLSDTQSASVDNVWLDNTTDVSCGVPAICALANQLSALCTYLKGSLLTRKVWATAVLLIWTSQAYSEYYNFWLSQRPETRFESGQAACDQYMVEYPFLVANFIPLYFSGGDYREGQLAGGFCDLHRKSDGGGLGIIGVNLDGNECPNNGVLNIVVAACESSPYRLAKKALAAAVNPISCAPSSLVGNPVTVSDGFKIEPNGIFYTGLDLYYNGIDGRWLVDFSQRLLISNSVVILMRPDGGQILFSKKGASYLVDEGQLGSLTRSDNWIYSSPTERMVFNAQGALEKYEAVSGEAYTLTYSSDVVSISSNSGEVYEVTNASQRPISIKSKGAEVSFEYDTAGRLTKLVGSKDGQTEQRIYHYEDPRDPKLLTGTTDERGVRYATWSYDDQGRAISSEHAGGAEKVTLAYNDDGSTTVTNALGKQTTYRFQVIQGVKRITAIEGEPSADCPAANSTYTYNDRGQVVTATDAEGRVTRYAYNDRGLEISRVEGEGTAEARTVTTEWDSVRYRRTQVTADGRRTLYTYDDQGRLLSEHTEAVSAN